MVDLIDYGGGNIGSMARCLRRLGVKFRTVSRGSDFDGANPVVLPGVGAFGPVMDALDRRGFRAGLIGAIEEGVPYLGVCVGLQILFDSSEESPSAIGLSLVPGSVRRFVVGKVPQIGWNELVPAQNSGFARGHAYFVNSYYPVPDDEADVVYRASYGIDFCAGIRRGSATAFQFHPEKSGSFGHRLIERWIDAL